MSSLSRSKIVGLKVYTLDAKYVGTIEDLVIRLEDPSNVLILIRGKDNKLYEVPIKSLAAIGDIALLSKDIELREVVAGEEKAMAQVGVGAEKPAEARAPVTKPAPTPTPSAAATKPTTPTTPQVTTPQPQVQQPYTMKTQWYIPRCPTCGTALAYYLQYNKWYCHKCRRYVDVSPELLSKVPRCPTCGGYLSYIDQYGKWYCYHCRRYYNV